MGRVAVDHRSQPGNRRRDCIGPCGGGVSGGRQLPVGGGRGDADEVVRAATAAGGEAVAVRADVTVPYDVSSFAGLSWRQGLPATGVHVKSALRVLAAIRAAANNLTEA
jgi:hypothetical protein